MLRPISVCEECDLEAIEHNGISTTLVGYMPFTDDNGVEHNHDDNCMKIFLKCPNGHVWPVFKRRRCDVEGCDWVGDETCRCHSGKKVDEWPDVPFIKPAWMK